MKYVRSSTLRFKNQTRYGLLIKNFRHIFNFCGSFGRHFLGVVTGLQFSTLIFFSISSIYSSRSKYILPFFVIYKSQDNALFLPKTSFKIDSLTQIWDFHDMIFRCETAIYRLNRYLKISSFQRFCENNYKDQPLKVQSPLGLIDINLFI